MCRLVPLLDENDVEIRETLVAILKADATPERARTIEVLAGILPLSHAAARLIAGAIASVEPDDPVSVQLIQRFYGTNSLHIEMALIEAVERLGLADRRCGEFLTRMATHPDAEIRELSAASIQDSHLASRIVQDIFVPDLLSNRHERWERAWTALNVIAAAMTPSEVPQSLRIHDSPRVRLAALAMLQRAGIAEDAEAIVAPAVEMLNSPDAWTRTKAAEVLGRAGPKARVAIPALGRALSDEDRPVSSTAMEALKAIGTERR